MLDILCYYEGKTFSIEVKTPDEMKYIMKHYDKLKILNPKDYKNKKKHYIEQIQAVEAIKKSGNIAFFTDSIENLVYTLNTYAVILPPST